MTRRRPIWHSGYWLVLGLIITSYVICAAQQTLNGGKVAVLIQLATVAVILGIAAKNVAVRRFGWIVLATASSAVVAVWLVGATGRLLDVLLSGASMVAYLTAPIVIIQHQLRKDRVDVQTLLAAIAAYLLVGMFYTFTYNFIAHLSIVPTFGENQPDSLTNQLFFSFTTLTTTGMGISYRWARPFKALPSPRPSSDSSFLWSPLRVLSPDTRCSANHEQRPRGASSPSRCP